MDILGTRAKWEQASRQYKTPRQKKNKCQDRCASATDAQKEGEVDKLKAPGSAQRPRTKNYDGEATNNSIALWVKLREKKKMVQ